ncbi:phosphoketolase, partial [Streptomyces sp. NRRL S-444]
MTSYPISELDAHWRAANYLAVGQIYLMDNPLLTEPLRPEHIKPRLLGHWGTSPGLNLVHTHLNRVIKDRSLDALCVWGPGHGGPAVLANSWLEGTYTETYPDITRDAAGMAKLFRQFSFPGGVPSHVAPETPGSIHEGGELGYSLAHAYGAALDHPGLLVACVIGDGEAETGPLAASWHSNKFLDPVHDGAVLPILHLNGYKIANPTVLSRIPQAELDSLLRGYGHDPLYVTGSDPAQVHHAMARAMDEALDRIAVIQREARTAGTGPGREYARWPMIVLRTPKGWTGPATVDGDPVAGTWRAHQVPLAGVRENPAHLKQLETWLRSYRPEELFDVGGQPSEQVLACVPQGERRLGAVPWANGGRLLRPLPLPSPGAYAVPVDKPGNSLHEPTRVLGRFLSQIMRDTAERRDFRVVGPDETASNRLDDLYDATGKAWQGLTAVSYTH